MFKIISAKLIEVIQISFKLRSSASVSKEPCIVPASKLIRPGSENKIGRNLLKFSCTFSEVC